MTNGIWANETYAIFEQKLQMSLSLLLSLCQVKEHLPRRGLEFIWGPWVKGHAQQLSRAAIAPSPHSKDADMWMGNKCLLLQVTEILGYLLHRKLNNVGLETLSEIPFAVLFKGNSTHTNICFLKNNYFNYSTLRNLSVK